MGETKDTLGKEDLVKRFKELNQNLGVVNANVSRLQNALGQEQARTQQILGAMQNTGELLEQIVGREEAQKIVTEIQNPQKEEVKKDGKEN